MEIEALLMDITKIGEKADVIVNAANESLLGGGGVDGAIHYAAGPGLLAECRTLHGCRPGEAKATKAYRLKNKYIIHTVGPRYYSDPNPEEKLTNAYLNSLKLADSLGMESIAFPSLSTGAFGYPIEEAAEVSAKVLTTYQAKNLKRAYMCIYPREDELAIYQAAFRKYQN
ncbi:MAG: macro domain-containing protein [Bacilli bacterium]|nr:macro domain-containing protein [Bacilli bacterium]